MSTFEPDKQRQARVRYLATRMLDVSIDGVQPTPDERAEAALVVLAGVVVPLNVPDALVHDSLTNALAAMRKYRERSKT